MTITTPEQMREAAARAAESPETPMLSANWSTAQDAAAISAGMSIAAAIRAIPIAPQPVAVTVKPLVWREQSNTCQVADTPWGSAAVQDESHALCPHRWGWWMVGSDEDDSATGYGHNIELAKAAADADYKARILSALTIHPADPMSDPRVKALVDACKIADTIARDLGWHRIYDATGSALRAIGGEA